MIKIRHFCSRLPAGLIFALAGTLVAGCGAFETEAPGDPGPIIVFGGDAPEQSTNVGVNQDLWRASLDTLAFMPIRSADPFGGTILTDWYAMPENPDERVRLNVRIRDRDLSANSLRVTAFRQVRGAAGDWVDAEARPGTARDIENAILTRVRQWRSGRA